MSFIKNIQNRFHQGSVVEKLIYANIVVYVLTVFMSVFKRLFKGTNNLILEWFALSVDINSLFYKPWTLISFGFLHADFIHILSNLIVLYYIGNLFIDYFTQKQLLQFYSLGTLFGGLLFLLSYNYFPLFENQFAQLIGASAGISALFLGIATYMPNYQLKIRFIGFVKLWHLAAIWVLLDVMQLAGNNAGGHFAHIGGAVFGFLYVRRASHQKTDLWASIKKFLTLNNKPLKTVYKSKTSSFSKKPSATQQAKIDEILDKISKSGYEVLTKSEKDYLFQQGKKNS